MMFLKWIYFFVINLSLVSTAQSQPYEQAFQGAEVRNSNQNSQGNDIQYGGEQQAARQTQNNLQNISATVPKAYNVALPSANHVSNPTNNEDVRKMTPTATGAVQRIQTMNSSQTLLNSLAPAYNGPLNLTQTSTTNASTLPPGISSIPTSDIASANLSQKASDMTRFTNGQIVPSDFDAEVSLTATPTSAFTFMSPSLYTQTLQTVRNNQQEWYTLTRVTMVMVTSTPPGVKSMTNTSMGQSESTAKETGKSGKGGKSKGEISSSGAIGSSESVDGEESGVGNSSSSSGSETAAENSGANSMMMSTTMLLLVSGSFIFL